jgi:hypothetical protein
MLTTECPICAGKATLDDELTTLACDGCTLHVEIAPDYLALEAAA